MIRILNVNEVREEEIFARNEAALSVEGTVSEILKNVKEKGDAALKEYTLRFDQAELEDFEVSAAEMKEALSKIEPSFLKILEEAAANIRRFHEQQKRSSFILNEKNGVILGQKIVPLQRVGVYVPGGTAAYPSSVLMNVIPAKIAGCKNIVMVSPPDRNGKISDVILAAAAVAGVDHIYKIGGAQAIGALAYGSESIPNVDKIVGPGNAYVAEAKRQVYGQVSIDMIAGPSEILIIADAASDPRFLAADLLSQAEHDKMASAVLVTDSKDLAETTAAEIERQLEILPRKAIASASIENNGKIIIAASIEQAIEIANRIAPEHLELCIDQPFDHLDAIRNAGSVFLGRNTPEALGDYFAGTNHILPTSGTARFSSPLSVDDFVKKMQYTYYSADALRAVSDKVAAFARKEGLYAHARSALIRNKEDDL
ncbi:MAG: histidinol dehydrogenase [Erysipelotrichaceae bacterium]|nr:histidinol dehydrogenase [Erysipelotrichaceae bacterium]